MSVEYAKPPTVRQRAQVDVTATGQTVASTLTTLKQTPAKKVPAQQEPIVQHAKPIRSKLSQSSTTDSSEQLASQGGNPSTAAQSQLALQQSSNQVVTLLTTPQVYSPPEHTKTSLLLSGMDYLLSSMSVMATGVVDPPSFANMNRFECAKHLPHKQPVTAQEIKQVQSFPVTSVPGSLNVSLADASQSNLQMNVLNTAATLPLPPGAQMGQQHLSVMQADDQESSTGNSSLSHMQCSPHNTGDSSQPTPNFAVEVSESIPSQEWPSVSPEPLPTTAQSNHQASSLSKEGGAMVQVEGVAELNNKHLRVAFDDEEKGGGEIAKIMWKGDIALITFKDVKGECMLLVHHIVCICIMSSYSAFNSNYMHLLYIVQLLHRWHPKLFGR